MIREAIRIAREELVKPFEGYHKRLPNGDCEAYPDPGSGGDPWTIGYGSTGKGIGPGMVWTHRQAEIALDLELEHCAASLLKYSPGMARATARQFAALISFVYNCGIGNYRISTLRKRAETFDWPGAQEQIVRWNKAAGRVMRGLTRRRALEAYYLGEVNNSPL